MDASPDAPPDAAPVPEATSAAKPPAWTHITAALAALAATIGLFAWIGSMDFPKPGETGVDTSTGVTAPDAPSPSTNPANTVLIFSKTAGFRHDSIPEGIAAFTEIAKELGFSAESTEDSAAFTPDNLKRFAAVVFLNTTGDVLNDEQQKAFEGYIAGGGNYLGVHAAADTEYDWPFYGNLVGAYFARHPAIQEATVEITDAEHPATRGLDRFWKRTDEWYDYRAVPPAGTRILAQLDPQSYDGWSMTGQHPIAWCQEVGPARAIYTGGGHTKESYSEPAFRQHLAGALAWATHRDAESLPANETASLPESATAPAAQ